MGIAPYMEVGGVLGRWAWPVIRKLVGLKEDRCNPVKGVGGP